MMKKKIGTSLAAVMMVISFSGCSILNQVRTVIDHVENQNEDTENKSDVRYQDDYYDYVTSDLLSQIDLEPTDAQWSWFGELDAEASEDMQKIINDIVKSDRTFQKGSTEQKIHDLYECIIDLENQDGINLEPVQKYLDLIQNADTVDAYVQALATFSAEKGFASIIGGYNIDQDMADSETYAVYLMGPDTLIGKEYLESDSTKDACDTYFQYMVDTFKVYGMSEQESQNARTQIEKMLRGICSATLSTQEYYDPEKTYNLLTEEELQKVYSNIDVQSMLETLELTSVDTFILRDVEQARYVNSILVEENLDTLKLYSTFVCLNDIGNYASKDLRALQNQCYNDLHGITESRSIERQATDDVENMLSWEFAKIYVETYFSEESKSEVEKMITDIISGYKEILNRQDWMSEATKEKAIRKLETMVIKIGYPDEWPAICDYLQITPLSDGGSYLSNLMDLSSYSVVEDRKKIGQPVDRTEWGMTPQTVNAYYNPSNNEIVFPAAMLQPPFYNSESDYATNLGGIGYVVAHEITHAFDANGSKYDEYGNYNVWWTQEEYEQFTQLSQSIIDYYNGFEFLGSHVDGDLTLSENIADLGAITCISSIIGDNPKELSKMFSQMAYNWATDETATYGLYLLTNDTHAPNKIRVNAVLSSCDAFYEAYDITETDQMYVAPENRVGIWK